MKLRLAPVLLALASLALLAGPASAAKIVNGSPNLKKLRGKPVAMMFFHPL